MKKLLVILLLGIVPSVCSAMESDQEEHLAKKPRIFIAQRSSAYEGNNASGSSESSKPRRSTRKRNQPSYLRKEDDQGGSWEDSGSSISSESEVKKIKVSAGLKRKSFIVSPSDTAELLEGTRSINVRKLYVRELIKVLNISRQDEMATIKAFYEDRDVASIRRYAAQQNISLKKYFMQCPGCECMIQSRENEAALMRNMFEHWFTTRRHQSVLHGHVLKLFGDTEESAWQRYAQYKHVKIDITPLPAWMNVGDEGSSCEQGASDDEVVQSSEQQEGAELPDQNEYFIVAPLTTHQHAYITMYGNSRPEVLRHYLRSVLLPATKQPVECASTYVQALRNNEGIKKQFLVQEHSALTRLVCPEQECFHLCSDESELHKETALRMLLVHYIITHKSDNPLYTDAQERIGATFEEARDKGIALAMAHNADNQFDEN